MDNKRPILIVDSNQAFCTLLREGLEQTGLYRIAVAGSGAKAQRALTAERYDLAIVDMGVINPDGVTVARMLRQQQADLRLMVIPINEEVPPPELADLGIQGVLPKPFFLPQLPDRIANALAQPIGGPGPMPAEAVAPASATSLETSASDTVFGHAPRSPERIPQIIQRMDALCQEMDAETAILTRGNRLIAHSGRLSAENAEKLAQAIDECRNISARVARVLGQEQMRFEQSVEGGEYTLYSLTVSEDVILSAASAFGVPLGLIRHQVRTTANHLRPLVEG